MAASTDNVTMEVTPNGVLTVNIDSDGVIYDYSGMFWRMAEEAFNQKFPASTEWAQHQTMGIGEEEFWDFFHKCAINGVFRFGEAIPGSVETIRAWYKRGYRLRVVTHKSLRQEYSTYHAQTDMVHWLYEQGILNKVELFFPRGQYHKQGIPANIIIDDKPDMLWVQEGAGRLNLLFDQPWNTAVDTAEFPNVVRAKGWEHINELVAGYEAEVLK